MTIWLTRCTTNLGRALVPGFPKSDPKPVGWGRNEITLADLKSNDPTARFYPCHRGDDDHVASFYECVLATAAPPDLLINTSHTSGNNGQNLTAP